VFTSNLNSQNTWLKVKLKLVNLAALEQAATPGSGFEPHWRLTTGGKLPSFGGYNLEIFNLTNLSHQVMKGA